MVDLDSIIYVYMYIYVYVYLGFDLMKAERTLDPEGDVKICSPSL